MIRNRTAHIKPATRDALMDQLALAANVIIAQRQICADLLSRRWWHRFMWWRA